MVDKIVPFVAVTSNELQALENDLSLDIKNSIRNQQQPAAQLAVANTNAVLLNNVFALAIKRMNRLLKGLFENADNALFELALKANDQAGQKLHFDTMRELRYKRKQMITTYSGILSKWLSYDHLTTPSEQPLKELRHVFSDEINNGHSAVDEDTIYTTQLLAQSVEDLFRHLSSELIERTEVCLAQPMISSPWQPSIVSAAFLAACTHLQLEKAGIDNIIILFDRYILRNIATVYGEVNQALRLAGIASQNDSNIYGLPVSNEEQPVNTDQ